MGSLTNELDIQKKTPAVVQLNLWNNLIRTTNNIYSNNGNILNTDPLFIDKALENFEVSANSQAVKKGIDLSNDLYFNSYLNKDIKGISRIFPSTLGCYEK